MVVAEDPDILALQEVRLDATFTAPRTLPHWNNPAGASKTDAGNQAEHILSYLAQARVRARQARGEPDKVDEGHGYYQFVFQPAMSMVDM